MKTYNNDVMEAIRQRLGLEPDDNSKDEQIMNMDKSKAFQEYCLWNGLVGRTIIIYQKQLAVFMECNYQTK